jgi:hypothetical protein
MLNNRDGAEVLKDLQNEVNETRVDEASAFDMLKLAMSKLQ